MEFLFWLIIRCEDLADRFVFNLSMNVFKLYKLGRYLYRSSDDMFNNIVDYFTSYKSCI